MAEAGPFNGRPTAAARSKAPSKLKETRYISAILPSREKV
jgi:hypothetical protein